MTEELSEDKLQRAITTEIGIGPQLIHEPVKPPWEIVWRRLLRNKLAVVGMSILLIILLTALMAPLLAQQHPNANGVFKAYPRDNKLSPSWEHPMGTDDLGRDMLSLIIYGSRISLMIGVLSVGFAILLGVILGAIAGFFRGITGNIIMRIMDIMLSFPSILLALVVVTIVGPGLINAMLAVGIVSIPIYARISRASVLSENTREYVLASKALGANSLQIMIQHILPNILSPIIVAASLGIATAILDAAGLGFLGLGAQPPTPEWGLMLSRNKTHLFTSPWMMFFPGISIMFLVLGFNLLGDGLRDALDPRLARVKVG